MFWLDLLARVFQLLGFARGAAALWRRHEEKAKEQAVADAPTTRAELERTLERGEL